MVSLWPWKTRDASPASFEKALAALATRIATTQARLDHTRAASRRVRLLTTLYLAVAYIVYAVVLALVVGRRGMGPWEWTGLAGGPVVLYVVRRVLAAVYAYRIDARAALLRDLQAERAQTIQRLKDATKYDSTQQLLDKYGREESGKTAEAAGPAKGPLPGSARTNRPPPPTANLAPPTANLAPPTANLAPPTANSRPGQRGGAMDGGNESDADADVDADAEFAPNAFEPGQVPARVLAAAAAAAAAPLAPPLPPPPSHWYDRVLDSLLGEDETATKNRIVLLCGHCRLVNGQAPPGTRTLAEVGAWRCMGCGALNGEVEVKEVVAQVTEDET